MLSTRLPFASSAPASLPGAVFHRPPSRPPPPSMPRRVGGGSGGNLQIPTKQGERREVLRVNRGGEGGLGHRRGEERKATGKRECWGRGDGGEGEGKGAGGRTMWAWGGHVGGVGGSAAQNSCASASRTVGRQGRTSKTVLALVPNQRRHYLGVRHVPCLVQSHGRFSATI